MGFPEPGTLKILELKNACPPVVSQLLTYMYKILTMTSTAAMTMFFCICKQTFNSFDDFFKRFHGHDLASKKCNLKMTVVVGYYKMQQF